MQIESTIAISLASVSQPVPSSLSSRWDARPWLRVGRAVRNGFLPNGFHAMNHDDGDDAFALAVAAVADADWRRRVVGEATGDICFVLSMCKLFVDE